MKGSKHVSSFLDVSFKSKPQLRMENLRFKFRRKALESSAALQCAEGLLGSVPLQELHYLTDHQALNSSQRPPVSLYILRALSSLHSGQLPAAAGEAEEAPQQLLLQLAGTVVIFSHGPMYCSMYPYTLLAPSPHE